MILPSPLYRLINDYARCNNLHILITTLSKDDRENILHVLSTSIRYPPKDLLKLVMTVQSEDSIKEWKLIQEMCKKASVWHLHISSIENLKIPDCVTMSNILTLELGCDYFQVLPQLSFPKLRRLYIQNGGEMAMTDLIHVPLLRFFSIRWMLLTHVPDFSNMPLLTELNIVNCNVKYLSNFSRLPKLSKLDLSGSDIESMPDFDRLDNIIYIKINYIHIDNKLFPFIIKKYHNRVKYERDTMIIDRADRPLLYHHPV